LAQRHRMPLAREIQGTKTRKNQAQISKSVSSIVPDALVKAPAIAVRPKLENLSADFFVRIETKGRAFFTTIQAYRQGAAQQLGDPPLYSGRALVLRWPTSASQPIVEEERLLGPLDCRKVRAKELSRITARWSCRHSPTSREGFGGSRAADASGTVAAGCGWRNRRPKGVRPLEERLRVDHRSTTMLAKEADDLSRKRTTLGAGAPGFTRIEPSSACLRAIGGRW